MNDTVKKAGLILIIVLAVIAIGYTAFKYSTSDQPVASGVDNSLPPGSKTGKQREIEAMQGGAGKGKDESVGDVSGGGR